MLKEGALRLIYVGMLRLAMEMHSVRQDSTPRTSRRPRSDGERNRTRLIEAAKRAFAAGGADVSLEQVARDAEISIASLYRHFPTRDDLISAVYREETDALIEAAQQLMIEREPAAALREWLVLFVGFLDAKNGMAKSMETLIGGPEDLFSETSDRLASPVRSLVARAVEAGAIQAEIEPLDFLRALAGVANIRPAKGWKISAIRMIDVLLKGLQDKN